jgi:hypothetical protein
MNSLLHRELALARADELRRGADERRRAAAEPRHSLFDVLRRAYLRGAANRRPSSPDAEVRIRFGRPDEVAALHRLAALDDGTLPASPVLVAEVGRDLWAARSLETGDVIATPFEWTNELVELLAVRAEQLRAAGSVLDGEEPSHLRRAAPAHAH